jgi:hypothetical protein
VKIDCGVGTVPPATTAGAGASEGNALVVDSAAGAPGAAATAAATGKANGVKVLLVGAAGATLEAESGAVTEGTNGVPAGMLLCANAVQLSASINPKPTSAIIARVKRGCRRIRYSAYIFTDYCSRFGSQTS